MSGQPRHPKGTPAGGRFAGLPRPDDPLADVGHFQSESTPEATIQVAMGFSHRTGHLLFENHNNTWRLAPDWDLTKIGAQTLIAASASPSQTHLSLIEQALWGEVTCSLVNEGHLLPGEISLFLEEVPLAGLTQADYRSTPELHLADERRRFAAHLAAIRTYYRYRRILTSSSSPPDGTADIHLLSELLPLRPATNLSDATVLRDAAGITNSTYEVWRSFMGAICADNDTTPAHSALLADEDASSPLPLVPPSMSDMFRSYHLEGNSTTAGSLASVYDQVLGATPRSDRPLTTSQTFAACLLMSKSHQVGHSVADVVEWLESSTGPVGLARRCATMLACYMGAPYRGLQADRTAAGTAFAALWETSQKQEADHYREGTTTVLLKGLSPQREAHRLQKPGTDLLPDARRQLIVESLGGHPCVGPVDAWLRELSP